MTEPTSGRAHFGPLGSGKSRNPLTDVERASETDSSSSEPSTHQSGQDEPPTYAPLTRWRCSVI